MSKKYIVQPGDTLAGIAKKHQLPSWEAIYQSEENKELRKKRHTPQQIQPGDVIVLPLASEEDNLVDILAAIDGTGSSEWINKDKKGKILGGNSHVYRFCQDFLTGHSAAKGKLKNYFHGPNDLGTNVGQIVKQVVNFVKEKRALAPQARISMVGHSRGGLIAILASQELNIPIHFLGLYDAVDRFFGPSGSKIPKNVGTVYHALRDPSTHSRMGFGNCGRDFESGVKYHEEMFMASHGGIGGDSKGAHKAESKHTKILTAAAFIVGGPVAAAVAYNAIDVTIDLEADQQGGKKANRYIRNGASKAGLRIAG